MQRRNIKLDPVLFERATKRASQLGYGSVHEYIIHLIEQDAQSMESDDIELEVTRHLQGLGYLE